MTDQAHWDKLKILRLEKEAGIAAAKRQKSASLAAAKTAQTERIFRGLHNLLTAAEKGDKAADQILVKLFSLKY